MTLASAFSTAWTDLKKVASKVASVLTKDSAAIQTAVAGASAVAAAIDPALAPVITEFDALEEAVIGKICALASDVANATTLSSLFAEEWPAIQSLVAALKSHPTVATVAATLTVNAATAKA